MNNSIQIGDMMLDPAQFVQQAAGSGQVGDIARTLLTAGLALGDIAQVITAAQTGGAMPAQQAQMLSLELAYVKQQQQQRIQRLTYAAAVVALLASSTTFPSRNLQATTPLSPPPPPAPC